MSQISPCRRAVPAFLAVFALAGGCSWQDAPEESGMHVTAEVHEVHYCSKFSPEITIANPPHDTDYYEVRLDRLGESGNIGFCIITIGVRTDYGLGEHFATGIHDTQFGGLSTYIDTDYEILFIHGVFYYSADLTLEPATAKKRMNARPITRTQ